MSRGGKENEMPKLTISGFGDEICEDFGRQLETMASFGLDHIDPRGVDGKNISDLTADEARKAKRQLDDHGFRVACVGSPIGKYDITADFEPELEKFKRTLETTLILGADCIRIFSFFIPSGHSPDEYRDEVMLRLGRYLEASEGSGVLLLPNDPCVVNLALQNREGNTAAKADWQTREGLNTLTLNAVTARNFESMILKYQAPPEESEKSFGAKRPSPSWC